MTEMRHSTSEYTRAGTTSTEPTGWVGWVLFAGVMLFLIGTFQAIAGLTAIFRDTSYWAAPKSHLVITMDYTAWGWTHLIIGVIALFAGWGVIAGQTWARAFGIALAFLSAVANLMFLNAQPVWSVVMITVDVLVIYALAVHGREVKAL